MWQLFHKFCTRISSAVPTCTTLNHHAQLLFPEFRNLSQNHLFVHGRLLTGASNVYIGQGGARGRSRTGGSQTESSRGLLSTSSRSNAAFSGGVAFSSSQPSDPFQQRSSYSSQASDPWQQRSSNSSQASDPWQQRSSYSSQASDPWQQRSSYKWFLPVQTRWKDNDQYGHVNNAVYHAIFDSVINVYLIRKSGLDPTSPSVPRGYMLSNSCRFTSSARYPHVYLAGLGVSHIGNSSVRYQLGLFQKLDDNSGLLLDLVQGHWAEDEQVGEFGQASIVTGEYVHVFVSPDTGKACPIPDTWRPQLQHLVVNSQD